MSAGECLANVDAVVLALEGLKAVYEGTSSDATLFQEPFASPDGILDSLLSADVVFSIAKTIAVQNGLEAMIASNRPLFLYAQDRASYYTEAVEDIGREISMQEDFKNVTSKYFAFGEPTDGSTDL